MALLAHREFVLLLALIAAELLGGSHGQELSSSRSSRREASDDSTEFVGFENRAGAVKTICLKAFSRIFDDYIEDLNEESGIWPILSEPPALHDKPAISKSWMYFTFTIRV